MKICQQFVNFVAIQRFLGFNINLFKEVADIDNDLIYLSSPRAKRAGPKGQRAESARAVTGRRCPHSGKEEDFLTGL